MNVMGAGHVDLADLGADLVDPCRGLSFIVSEIGSLL